MIFSGVKLFVTIIHNDVRQDSWRCSGNIINLFSSPSFLVKFTNITKFLNDFSGVWGSAFTILFQRLFGKEEENPTDDGKKELGK